MLLNMLQIILCYFTQYMLHKLISCITDITYVTNDEIMSFIVKFGIVLYIYIILMLHSINIFLESNVYINTNLLKFRVDFAVVTFSV